MKAVILAGGLGTRMGNLCDSLPKPLIEVHGKPMLQHQLEILKREGISDFLIITGYRSESIEAYFGDGRKFGVNITYYKENTPLGTAGALFRLNFESDFLLCNGDLIFDFDLSSMLSFHHSRNALATLFVHPNSHPFDSVTLDTDESGRVISIYKKNKKPEFFQNLCNAGIQIVSPELLTMYNFTDKADFDSDVIFPAVSTNRIFAYKSTEYVHDVGTPERLQRVSLDIASGMVKKRNRREAQKAVFVDRDGTLNIHKGYITSPADIELTEGTAEAINALHRLGYLVVMITNQPVIARGECSLSDLEKIHNRLSILLSDKGAFLDGIYFCPHHPDKGFEGEIEEYKTVCNCRKPAPGLIFQAQKDFNIELSESYMVGDSTADIEAGKNAGCKPVYVGDGTADTVYRFGSLAEFAEMLTSNAIN
ncbi:MAG: D-glycero-beta-D-manno-heptose 1,7-bisphosphate 7-phosphatase [Clostridia bacterium]|nr:D-glycero-beta-D-manno-heptose 1,7-bisphosphate 7-phosphatase [Clostridia bacterium]